jgi:hypothetical protein
MQEALLSKELLFLQRTTRWTAREHLHSLIHHSDQPHIHYQQYSAIEAIAGMVPNDTRMEVRLYHLGLERETTKALDLVRAVYPLFSLEWPSVTTTMEEAQIYLIKSLGDLSTTFASLWGPILPQPWSWAPAILPGCSGSLQRNSDMRVTSEGLYAFWECWDVKAIRRSNDSSNAGIKSRSLAEAAGNILEYVHFRVEGWEFVFVGYVFCRPECRYPWNGLALKLLRLPRPTDNELFRNFGMFSLVACEPQRTIQGDWKMHRVGSLCGGFSGSNAPVLRATTPYIRAYIS